MFVFVVLLLPFLIGISALGIDVGGWYTKSRKAQAAADAAALAAAAWLRPETTDPYGDAILAAQTSVGINMAGAGADITPGFDGNTEHVKVVINATANTYFAKMFGFNTVDVSKTAVATRAERDIRIQIFANGADCHHDGGFLLKDSGLNIDGGIVSNGQFTVNGDNNVAGAAVQYIGTPAAPSGKKKPKPGAGVCAPTVTGSGNGFPSPQALPTADPNSWDWPMVFNESDFSCTYAGPFTYTDDKGKTKTSDDLIVDSQHGYPDGYTFPPGVYCADGKIKVESNNVSGNVTFISKKKIEIYGANSSFTAYTNGVVFFAGCDNYDSDGSCKKGAEMHLSADNLHWEGIAYAPAGDIEIGAGADDEDKNADNVNCTNCLVEGEFVEIKASNFSMHGTPAGDPLQPVGLVKLIQ